MGKEVFSSQVHKPELRESIEISPHFRDLFDKILENAGKNKKDNKPLVIALNGPGTSGKTTTAIHFSDYLKQKGIKNQTVHLDDFHFETTVRNFPANEAEVFCEIYFNFSRLIKLVLDPLHEQGKLEKIIHDIYNYQTDQYDMSRDYNVTPDSVVIVEGIFVLREELLKYYDYKVLFHIDEETALNRNLKRWEGRRDPEMVKKRFQNRYNAGYKLYEKRHDPHNGADIIIDHNEEGVPIIIKSLD